MVNRAYKIVEILFFGAGKKGKYWIEVCKDFGIMPEGIIDNNEALCGSLCEDVMVYGPGELETLFYKHIFITCDKESEICQQLSDLGVDPEKIVIGGHNLLNHILYYAASNIVFSRNTTKIVSRLGSQKILFDLQNGMVLGGVEAWTYDLAKGLKEEGYRGLYLTTDTIGPSVIDKTYPVHMLMYKELHKESDKVELCVKRIIENLPCTIICNFPQTIFWSACIVKQLFPDQIRIIAVQHNDEQLYYEAYDLWQEYIDQCMVISTRIEKKLLSFGIERYKLRHLEWKVSCDENINRTWNLKSPKIQIGYAGRLTAVSKRVDLLLVLVEKLRKRNVCFRMNIAGAGEYEETLRQRIEEENIQNYVALEGYIDRKSIPDFWSRQDIMVSCSEHEGHSISQSEAMAEGAVPVITDVSGARDDVTDGSNGYIVAVGDIDTLADRICYLYHNREELERMGKQAHSTIYQRQKMINQTGLWTDLLRKVWET